MFAASLPDLDSLDLEAAKALLIAQHQSYTATLSSRSTEVERLMLLVEKLQRMPDHEACTDCGGRLRVLGEDTAEILEHLRACLRPGSLRTGLRPWGGGRSAMFVRR